MSQQNMRETASEIVRGALREKGVLGNTEVLQAIPDVVGSVKINEAGLRKVLERILESRNPLNALLGVLGFRLVNTRRLGEREGIGLEANGKSPDRLLTLDRERLEAAVEKMAGALAAGEKTSGDEIGALRERHSQLCQELEGARQETAQISREYDAARQAVAERVQYVLSLSGGEAPVLEQLTELLSDLELEAVWPEGGAEGADPALFTKLKAADPDRHRGKPCVRGGGRVLVKGVCFVDAAGEAPEG